MFHSNVLIDVNFAATQVLEGTQIRSRNVPRALQHILRALIAKVGLQSVRETKSDDSNDPHPAIIAMLHEVVRWKVVGFDR
jgi:hypothetical protein